MKANIIYGILIGFILILGIFSIISYNKVNKLEKKIIGLEIDIIIYQDSVNTQVFKKLDIILDSNTAYIKRELKVITIKNNELESKYKTLRTSIGKLPLP